MTTPALDAWELHTEARSALVKIDDVLERLRLATPTEDLIDVLNAIAADASELEQDAAEILSAAERRIRRPADAATSTTTVQEDMWAAFEGQATPSDASERDEATGSDRTPTTEGGRR